MATVITEECINCGACEPECPNTAIFQGGVEFELGGATQAAISDEIFFIVPEKCTECVGFYDYEACAAVCPVDCCVPDPDRPEEEGVLAQRAKELHPDKEFPDPVPSRFNPVGGDQKEESAADTAAAAPAPAAAADSAPAVAASASNAINPADFDVPVSCKSCGGGYTVAYRYFHPGTVLRCPHCQANFSPTRRMYLAIGEKLDRYADGLNLEVDRYNESVQVAHSEFEIAADEIAQTTAREIREPVEELAEDKKATLFG